MIDHAGHTISARQSSEPAGQVSSTVRLPARDVTRARVMAALVALVTVPGGLLVAVAAHNRQVGFSAAHATFEVGLLLCGVGLLGLRLLMLLRVVKTPDESAPEPAPRNQVPHPATEAT